MIIAERRVRRKTDLGTRLAALKPGDVFSTDRPITVEEVCEYISDEWRSELVNGVVYVMAPPTDRHEALAGWLFAVLSFFVDSRRLGKVRGSRSGVRISGTNLREPDILFFRTSRLDQMTESGVHAAPDLAIEVVDSAKARRDAVVKQAQYEQVGVAELVVVDLPWHEVRHFLFEEGTYRRLPVDPAGEIALRTVPGFHLRTEWLFSGPSFPNGLEVVQALLAEGS